MAFVVVSGAYRARLADARQRGVAPWPDLCWIAAPGGCLIGHDSLSVCSATTREEDRSGAAPQAQSDQPPNNEPGWSVIFDGYLANATELIAGLRSRPAVDASAPAKLVRSILDESGSNALYRLSGCFALVAIHQPSGEILALRDRLGGRTLYRLHREQNNGVLLATRSDWVQHLSGQAFEPNPAFMASRFALSNGPPPGHSAFAAVQEFLPGERLQRKDEKWSSERTPFDIRPDFDYRTPGDCVARFLELMNQAVAATLPASGDVACMLSGGLDSGPVAALANRQLAEQGRYLRCISWSLSAFPEMDEREWIELAGKDFASPPELFEASHLLPFSRIDEAMITPELPAFNAFRPLILGCYERAERAGCRVVLNGSGGDGIYPPYRFLTIDRIRRRHWPALWRDLKHSWRHSGIRGLLTDSSLREPFTQRLRRPARPPQWFTAEAKAAYQPTLKWPAECSEHLYPDYARQLLGVSMSFGRAHESGFANRFGLERRDPYQNEALVRFMLNAPHSLSRRGGRDKWIMRAATKDLLPPPFRWKLRTGWLENFLRAGFEQNTAGVERLIQDENAEWRRYIREDWIRGLLTQRWPGRQALLLTECVGSVLWSKRWRST